MERWSSDAVALDEEDTQASETVFFLSSAADLMRSLIFSPMNRLPAQETDDAVPPAGLAHSCHLVS